MKEATLNNKNYLLVEVPVEARDFMVLPHNNSIAWLGSNKTISGGNGGMINLECDVRNLTIIGKVYDILKDEEICKGLVELANEQIVDTGNKLHYKDHRSASWELDYDKATDSFQSWLESIEIDLTKQYLLIEKL